MNGQCTAIDDHTQKNFWPYPNPVKNVLTIGNYFLLWKTTTKCNELTRVLKQNQNTTKPTRSLKIYPKDFYFLNIYP
jgi:hypothetical protein